MRAGTLLSGAGPAPHDPTGAIRISREALVTAGLLAVDATPGDADENHDLAA